MNKRIAVMLLAASLLFAGCATKDPGPTQPPVPMPITSITTTHPDGTVERMEQVYDDNGIMIKANHYAGEKLVVSYNVVCDSEGRTKKMSDDTFGSGISMEYTYNADGTTQKIETKLNGATFFTQSYTYHENGEKATYKEEDTRSSTTIEYKYIYEEGVMRWEECYENGELAFSWEYTYNENGKRVTGTLRDSNFMLDGSREYRYEEAVTTVTTYDVEGAVRNVKAAYYNSDGSVAKETFTEGDEVTVTEYTYRQ